MRIAVALACAAVLIMVPTLGIAYYDHRSETIYDPRPEAIVPRDHPAYKALAYLVEIDVFEGHDVEQGFLDDEPGSVELTRQQFADAVAWALERTDLTPLWSYAILFELQRCFPTAAEGEQTPNSAYDDVPAGHWAYGALDYFTNTELLLGYPDGFFNEERVLTRYEFGQAVARLCDSWSGRSSGFSNVEYYLMEALRYEFQSELGELAKMSCPPAQF